MENQTNEKWKIENVTMENHMVPFGTIWYHMATRTHTPSTDSPPEVRAPACLEAFLFSEKWCLKKVI